MEAHTLHTNTPLNSFTIKCYRKHLQLAKANLGGSCLNSRITKIYCQQKLTNKVEGKETVLNNNKKKRYIDLI